MSDPIEHQRLAAHGLTLSGRALSGRAPNDELALVTVLPHTTALRGNRWAARTSPRYIVA